MLNKLLASVGIGAAKVDTILDNDSLMPGSMLYGELHIQGGEVEKNISGFNLALITQAQADPRKHTHYANHTFTINNRINRVIDSCRVAESMIIKPKEQRVIPFNVRLHSEIPVTQLDCPQNLSRVWVKTGLEIDMALDAHDTDYLAISPSPEMAVFIAAMTLCGFDLVKTDVKDSRLACDIELDLDIHQTLTFCAKQPSRGYEEGVAAFIAKPNLSHILFRGTQCFGSPSDRLLSWRRHASIEQLAEQIRYTLG